MTKLITVISALFSGLVAAMDVTMIIFMRLQKPLEKWCYVNRKRSTYIKTFGDVDIFLSKEKVMQYSDGKFVPLGMAYYPASNVIVIFDHMIKDWNYTMSTLKDALNNNSDKFDLSDLSVFNGFVHHELTHRKQFDAAVKEQNFTEKMKIIKVINTGCFGEYLDKSIETEAYMAQGVYMLHTTTGKEVYFSIDEIEKLKEMV